MRLWDFVIGNGMTWQETSAETQTLLNAVDLSELGKQDIWHQLRTIVQVQPDSDIFPVRGKYEDSEQYTIGLNYLSADFPMWFTLADCIASKLLTGKTPKVIKAYSFSPKEPQFALWPVNIMGNPDYRVDPTKDDFYRRLIDLRMAVRKKGRAGTKVDADKTESEQLALKILANATSYGIFVELNVNDLARQQSAVRYGLSEKPVRIPCDKLEEPGKYFHPLLGTLITGAARLMLAIAETLARQHGLDWAFCDTDSMALAKPDGMTTGDFDRHTKSICSWFKPLNP